MIYLLDTNAFSDLMREQPGLRARVAGLSPADRLIICTIVRGEIRYGISRLSDGRKKRDLETKAEKLFAVITCEPVPEAAGNHYAEMKLARERKGSGLDENDLWIASTARALSATLVSRDADFRQLDGLSLQDWTT
mgnify:CR=1 FL=1